MGAAFSSIWTQVFPPKPAFTEKDVGDLGGKVYIVTGSNTGVGKELARLLYAKNGRVYVAARSEDKAKAAIASIKEAAPASTGELVFLHLDLADLDTVKASAQAFLDAETSLHVLFNNAGVMTAAEPAPKTKQDYELHLGVNCVGTFLFTKLLTPLLLQTAAAEAPGTVRVVWLSSLALEITAPKSVGIALDNLDYHVPKNGSDRYSVSKAGAWALGVEYARRFPSLVSVPLNPGNLTSDLFRDQSFGFALVARLIGYPTVNGAYTELFGGLSPEITLQNSGSWVVPFGRLYPIRQDLVTAMRPESEGGSGGASKFYEWSEEQIKSYL